MLEIHWTEGKPQELTDNIVDKDETRDDEDDLEIPEFDNAVHLIFDAFDKDGKTAW